MVFTIAPGQLRLFFSGLLISSRQRQGISENIVEDAYLAEMLARFVQPTPELMEVLIDRPLLMELRRASTQSVGGKVLRELAETLLFLLGFYTRHLRKTGVGINTYAEATKSAYALVSARSPIYSPYLPVFQSFSYNIEPIARMLNDLGDEWLRREAHDLMYIMERYAVFHSQRDLELLLHHNVALLSSHASQKIIH